MSAKAFLYVLYSISASGDLLKNPVTHLFQYCMNERINHQRISVLLSQMFPPKVVQITEAGPGPGQPAGALRRLGVSS